MNSVLIISHAGIRQINRGVYRELQKICVVHLVIPVEIKTGSGVTLRYEPAVDGDPNLIPLQLHGRNPRTYYYSGLMQKIKEVSPEVIILENDPVSRLGIVLAWSFRRKGRKLYCQSYENVSRDAANTIRIRGWKGLPSNIAIHLLHYVMAFKTDGVLVVNRESQRIFTRYKYQHVLLTPLGYDPAYFFPHARLREDARQKLGVGETTLLVAYFGRMVQQKGVHLLLEALAQLKNTNWMLLLDNEFDAENEYVKRIDLAIKALGIQERVIRFEADHFQIANYMRAADVVVAPSLTTAEFKEQYGRAVQEAMACGCTCLVADSGHLPDLVGNTDLVFEQNNKSDLLAKLEYLLSNNNERKRHSEILSEYASTHLTIEVQARLLSVIIHANN